MPNSKWWVNYPWRMVQTNLREIDMEDIDAVKFAEELEDFGATVVLLNSAGIIASYETSLDFQTKSSFLHGDSLDKIIEECHKRGIRVIARTDFSKVRYDLYLKHPEWAYRTKEGNIVNYNGDVHVCPNSWYQEEGKLEILKEVFTRFDFDGVFLNMSGFLTLDYDYNYYGPCHCENCTKRFKEMFDSDVPLVDNPKDPVYLKYIKFKDECTKAHKNAIYNTLKSINENIAVNGYDYIRTESGTEVGQKYFLYNASSNTRQSSKRDKVRVADNENVDFMGFRYRHTTVSKGLMELRSWQNLANGGKPSIYFIGRFDNHKDQTMFNGVKKVFKFHKDHFDIYKDLHSIADTLLVRVPVMARSDDEAFGYIRALTEAHIPFDEISHKELTNYDDISCYKTIIVPNPRTINKDLLANLKEFVKNGGTLLTNGNPIDDELVGVKSRISQTNKIKSAMYEINKNEENIFINSKEHHYIAFGDNYFLNDYNENTTKYLSLIEDFPFGPPERCYYKEVSNKPGVIVNNYGKGKVVYYPFNIATFFYIEGYDNAYYFLKDIFNISGIKSIAKDLTEMVEVTLNKSNDDIIVQLVNLSGVTQNSYYKPLQINNVNIDLGLNVKEATAVNGGSVKVNGDGTITLNTLNDFELIKIKEK